MQSWKLVAIAGASAVAAALGILATHSQPQTVSRRHAAARHAVQPTVEPPAAAGALSPAALSELRTLPCFQTDASVAELERWLEMQSSADAVQSHLASRDNTIAQVAGTTVERYPLSPSTYRVSQRPDGLLDQGGVPLRADDQLLLPPANDLRGPEPGTTVPPGVAYPQAVPPQTPQSRPSDGSPNTGPPPVAVPPPSTPPAGRTYGNASDLLLNEGDSLLLPAEPSPQSQPPRGPATTSPPPRNQLPPPAPGPAEEIAPAPSQGDQLLQQSPVPAMPPPDTGSVAAPPAQDPHAELFACDPYPSATTCKKCHERIYREWSVSGHAYAAISPMFHKFEQRINELAAGTIGYFCLRCHSPVGTTIGLERHRSIYDSIPAAHEGVTCVVCHRVRQRYQRVNGERRIEPGNIFAPVYAGGDGHGLREVLSQKDNYKVKTSPHEKGPGQPIHAESIQFEQLSSSHFCVSCHQVAVYPGIKLEVVWEQYRASPARKQGITCQDCHMGKTPGRAEGYEQGPAAVVGTKQTDPLRKHSNHMFFGPGYSIAHPGTFPHNPKADDWRYDEWLEFDWRAGWGTDAFEEALEDGRIQAFFPKTWENVDDRYDAREVIDENLALLAAKKHTRKQVMENGSKVEGPFFFTKRRVGKPLKFHYVVTNMNSGHNMPSGSLGAQPQIWLNVVLTDPDGCHVWESGYVDANGDMADLHSLEVAAGRIKHDHQLFNLQTKFITTNIKGTDREMYLPINVDIDQLPFIRPSGFPITTMNHPPFIRMEGHSLPPLGHRKARYHVPGHFISKPGMWRLSVRMRSRAEPIYFMKFVRATPTMIQAMNERMLDFHEYAVEFEVH